MHLWRILSLRLACSMVLITQPSNLHTIHGLSIILSSILPNQAGLTSILFKIILCSLFALNFRMVVTYMWSTGRSLISANDDSPRQPLQCSAARSSFLNFIVDWSLNQVLEITEINLSDSLGTHARQQQGASSDSEHGRDDVLVRPEASMA